jgi:hypothetical protein
MKLSLAVDRLLQAGLLQQKRLGSSEHSRAAVLCCT